MVEFDHISNWLDDDPEHWKEFCRAAIKSITLYRDDFKKSMEQTDLKQLRKTGHRVKPVAEMIGVNKLITDYEKAKSILQNGKNEQQIRASINEVEKTCNIVIEEFHNQIKQL